MCTTGFDADGDSLIGCDDPDCWSLCVPHCPVDSTPARLTDCSTDEPHCGDGVCDVLPETQWLCSDDCGVDTSGNEFFE